MGAGGAHGLSSGVDSRFSLLLGRIMNGNAGLVNGPAEEEVKSLKKLPWCKFWDEHWSSPLFDRVSERTGVNALSCQSIFMFCMNEARKNGRSGTFPAIQKDDMANITRRGGLTPEAVLSVLDAFRAVGLVDGRGRIFKWKETQLTEDEKKKLKELADRRRASRHGESLAPATPEAPAPAPKSEPAEKAKPIPKPKAKPAPALLPGLEHVEPVKAEENSYRGLTGERLDYFERAWAAYNAPGKKGSKAKAADAFGKIGRSKLSSVRWTAELGERIIAQAARYTSSEVVAAINGYVKHMSTWINGECWTEDYDAVVAARTQGRRASSGGGADAFCASDLMARMMDGGLSSANVSIGGTVVSPRQGECYDCECTVVSSGAE